jgi:hypothetical protein
MHKLRSQSRTILAKRMIQIALERAELDRTLCVSFFKEAYMCELIRKEEIRRGFDLAYIDFDQILIDNPYAIGHLLSILLPLVFDLHVFSVDFFSRLPPVLMGLTT